MEALATHSTQEAELASQQQTPGAWGISDVEDKDFLEQFLENFQRTFGERIGEEFSKN